MLEMEKGAREVIREFVLGTLAPARGVSEVGDHESLVDTGIVDSLGVFQLVAFLEERFAVGIADEDISADNFGSIDAIERLIARKER